MSNKVVAESSASEYTNEVSGQSSITEPPRGAAIEEVLPIWREVSLHHSIKSVVVSGINAGIPKHQDARHIVPSCQLPQLMDVHSSSQQWRDS